MTQLLTVAPGGWLRTAEGFIRPPTVITPPALLGAFDPAYFNSDFFDTGLSVEPGVEVPTGRTPYSAPTGRITQSLTLEDVDITGPIIADGAGVVVTIRRFTATPVAATLTTAMFRTYGGARIVLEDGYVDGKGYVVNGYMGPGMTFRRVTFEHVADGGRFGHASLFEDCVWRNTTLTPVDRSQHCDVAQVTGLLADVLIEDQWSTVFRRCVMDCRSSPSATPTNGEYIGNAAFMIGNENYPRLIDSRTNNILVDDCFVNGGNYTINIRKDFGIGPNILFRDCEWGGVARYGCIMRPAGVVTIQNCVNPDGTPWRQTNA